MIIFIIHHHHENMPAKGWSASGGKKYCLKMRKKQGNLIFLNTVLANFIGIVALLLGFVLPVFGMSQQIFHNDKVDVLSPRNFKKEIPTAPFLSVKGLDQLGNSKEVTQLFDKRAARRELVPSGARPNWDFNTIPTQGASLKLPVQSGESVPKELENAPLFDVEIMPGIKKSLYKDISLFVWVIIGAFALLGVDIIYRKLGSHIYRNRKR